MNWLWRRMWRQTPLEANRSHRRAIARLTRIQRADLHRIIRQLKGLPLEDRASVVAMLPEWQQDLVRRYL